MKQLLLVILLVSKVLISEAQLFDGEYATKPSVYGESIAFNDADKRFKYLQYTCDYSIIGKGMYEVRGNELRLKFENKSKSPKSGEGPLKKIIVDKQYALVSDYAITVRVVENDDTAKPIADVSIHLSGTQKVAITNKEGVATLEYSSSAKQEVIISCVSCQSLMLNLESPGVYNIVVPMKYWKTEIIEANGIEFVYRIGNSGKDWIELSDVDKDGKIFYKKYWKRKNNITRTP